MRRRRWLQLLAGGVVPFATCSGRRPGEQPLPKSSEPPIRPPPGTTPPTPTTPVTPTPDRFERVVDVVDDLGCDPDGDRPCVDRLADVDGDSVLYRFPAGTYRFDGRLIVDEFDRVGIVGDGDVRLRPPTGFNRELILARTGAVHLANVTVDVTASNTTAGVTLIGDRELTVENVVVAGRGQHSDGSVVNAFALAVKRRDGTGVVRNVVARNGSAIGHYKGGNGRTGIWVGGRHRGTLRVENCRLEEFGNNGIYASRCPGRVQVVDSVFRNNNVSSVRISGEGSYAANVDVEIDLSTYDGPRTRMDGGFNTRGIIIEQNNVDKPAGARIVDSDVRILDTPRSQGAIGIGHYGRTLDIRDTTVRIDVDNVAAIRRKTPKTSGPTGVVAENVTITGSAAEGETIHLEGAPQSALRDVTVDQGGAGRDGVTLSGSSGCLVDGGSITAGRYPIVVDGEGPSDCWLLVGRRPDLASTGGTPGDPVTVTGLTFGTVRGNDCIDADQLTDATDRPIDRLGFLEIGATALTFVPIATA